MSKKKDHFTSKELEHLYAELFRYENHYHGYRDKTALKRALSTVRGSLLAPIFEAKKVEAKLAQIKKTEVAND